MNIFDALEPKDANLISFNSPTPESPAANIEPAQDLKSSDPCEKLYEPIKCAEASEARKIATEVTKLVAGNYNHFNNWYDAFGSTLELIEYALRKDEDKYLAKIGGMKRQALDCAVKVYGHLSRMWSDYVFDDVLGLVYMDIASRGNQKVMGQYFTPSDICYFMAKMTLEDVKGGIEQAKSECRKLKVLDSCVGSGAMLLAAKKVIVEEAGLAGLDHFEFYGQDIDPLCVRMAKIQMLLTDYRHMRNVMQATAYELKEKYGTRKASSDQ